MKLWKRFFVSLCISYYTILYLGRYRITYGKIGNRIEIFKTDDDLRKDHKFRVVQPLKIVKL